MSAELTFSGHQQGEEEWGARLGRTGGEEMEAGRRAGSCREESLASLNPPPPPQPELQVGRVGAQQMSAAPVRKPQHMGPGPTVTFPMFNLVERP